MSSSKISIVMASRNEGEEVKNTLNSLCDAIDKHTPEIILIDDFSTDGSCDAIDPHVQLIRNRVRRGMSYSRRLGLERATGDVLCILDPHMRFPKGLFDALYDIASTGCFAQPRIGGLESAGERSSEAEINWNSKWQYVICNWEKKAKNQGLMCPAWAFPRAILPPILALYDDDAFWWYDDSTISAWAMIHGIPIVRIQEMAVGHLFKRSFEKSWGDISDEELRRWNQAAYKKIFHPQTCEHLLGIASWGGTLKEDATRVMSDYDFFCSIADKEKVSRGPEGSCLGIA